MTWRFRALVAAVAVGTVAAAAPPLTGRNWDTLLADVAATGKGLLENTLRVPQSVQTATPSPSTAPVVTVSQSVRREIVEWEEATGRFEAVETVELRVRVSGYLQEVLFKDGQDVKKGDTLFIIDPRPYERALAQAEAEVNQAKVRLENSMLDVNRGRTLADRRILSEKVLDDRENVMREAQALSRIAEAKVKAAELDLSFTRITAPISGRIGRALVTPGNYIGAGGVAGATTLAAIVSQDPIYMYFDVAEMEALKYRRFTDKTAGANQGGAAGRVEVALGDETGFPHAGRIDFIDNRLDSGTGTLRVRAVFENEKRLLTPGMFARLRLQTTDKAMATLLPDEAIGSDQGNRFVYVVGADDIPARRLVKLGPLVEGLRVVRDGVNPDDWLITKGLTRVRPGQKVQANREPLKVSEVPGAEARKPQ